MTKVAPISVEEFKHKLNGESTTEKTSYEGKPTV